jgi:uncharacterized protein
MEQTALNWLIEQMKKSEKAKAFAHLFAEAKRKEKKQIIDNCNECASDIFRGQISIGQSVGEQFYTKKYSK